MRTPDLLRPEGRAKLDAARIVLRETEGFLYLPLLAQSQAAASAAQAYLLSDWQGPAPFHIAWPVPPGQTAQPPTAEEREALRGQLLENLDHAIALQAKGAILVLDTSPSERHSLALDTVSYLNQRREALRRRQLRLILLWPSGEAQALMAGAPDLWSMRALAPVIAREDLQPQEGLPAFQSMEPAAAPQGEGLTLSQQEQWQRWLAHRDLAAARLSIADALALMESLHEERAWPEMGELSEGVLHELQHPQEDAHWAQRASALQWLSLARYEQGDRNASLASAHEAVQIARRLAETNAAVFEPPLAARLNNLAVVLSSVGEQDEALAAAREAVNIRRRLTLAAPGTFEQQLAGSLSNFARILSDAGNRTEAVDCAKEAAEIYYRLVKVNPANFEPHLAVNLTNMVRQLSEIGERREALTVAREAVEIYRRLAQANPAAFKPNLAGSLNNLANCLMYGDEGGAALSAMQEAVDILRPLVQANPVVYEPDLARSLAVLATANLHAGEPAKARIALDEALELIEPWAQQMPAAFEGLRNWIQGVKNAADAAPD